MRSAAEYSITATLSVVPDPLKLTGAKTRYYITVTMLTKSDPFDPDNRNLLK